MTRLRKPMILRRIRENNRFDIQASPNGYVLRKLEPVQSKPAKVRFLKREGYTVAVADQPINEEALREALAEFP